jgi:hypothetical protein
MAVLAHDFLIIDSLGSLSPDYKSGDKQCVLQISSV